MSKRNDPRSQIKLNEGHWLEAMDRSYSVTEIIEVMLLKHPAISQTPELKEKVMQAQLILAGVYQDCGNKIPC